MSLLCVLCVGVNAGELGLGVNVGEISESESLLCCWGWDVVLWPSIVIGDHFTGVDVNVDDDVVGDVSLLDEAWGVADWVVVVFGVVAVSDVVSGVGTVDSSRYSLGIGAGSDQSSLPPLESVVSRSRSLGTGAASTHFSPHFPSLESFSLFES